MLHPGSWRLTVLLLLVGGCATTLDHRIADVTTLRAQADRCYEEAVSAYLTGRGTDDAMRESEEWMAMFHDRHVRYLDAVHGGEADLSLEGLTRARERLCER